MGSPYDPPLIPLREKTAIREALDQQGDPSKTLESLQQKLDRGSYFSQRQRILLTFVQDALNKDMGFEQLKRRTKNLRYWANSLKFPENEKKVVLSIFKHLNANSNNSQKKRLILSVVTSDLKTSLTVGSLVNCESCLNHRSGGYIDHLPAYSVDANTQVMLSFALSPEDFEDQDFEKIEIALNEGQPMKQTFDGGKRTAQFSWQDKKGEQHIVTSRFLGNAYLRQILKLGVTKTGKPGTQRETGYAQDHPAMLLMTQHIITLEAQIAKDIGGVTNEGITVFKSRNDDNQTYSDRGKDLNGDRGTMYEDYFITPED